MLILLKISVGAILGPARFALICFDTIAAALTLFKPIIYFDRFQAFLSMMVV